MKLIRFFTAIFLCMVVGGAFGVYAKDKSNVQAINDEILRFHIVANSNSKKDQKLKMQVREFIFQNVSFDEKTAKKDVENWFFENKDEMEEKINDFLKMKNSSQKAKISVKKEYFGIRKYNDFILPAGNYDAIVVKLGRGEGENFFCVMYPSLCMVDSLQENKKENFEKLSGILTDEQIHLLEKNDEEVVIKFKIIEILDKIL